MVVVMEVDAPEQAIEGVVSYLVAAGCDVLRSSGQTRLVLGVVGPVSANDAAVVSEMDGVAQVVRVSETHALSSRRFRREQSIVDGDWGAIGGPKPWIAVELVGADPGSSGDSPPPSLPYSVASGGRFDAAVTRAAIVSQSGGSLATLSLNPKPQTVRHPVLFVTREPCETVEAWLESADRELARGADRVVLLEAGGAYPDGTRTLDVVSLSRLRKKTHLPVVVDVPVIAGRRDHVPAVACASVAAGANGVILRAWVGAAGRVPRAPATLSWEQAESLADQLREIGEAVRP